MESRQAEKKREIESLPDGQGRRLRRFRIVKLEERIVPKKGGAPGNSARCITVIGCGYQDTYFCW